ncbi:ABC transporter substrate-binding protein [Glycomyces algeriensis]|uniref:Glycine/betaine ABC transporter permease n=1 Tax=Glycomyces algeriensis TaxID=256037 RepID=A0A9W6GCM6_9ACTN|nr:ABC transporter substrate-binding protein [Glycomyces algeriensis]MDA1368217.1 ABC transporter substrate-binding protein [Glycomyces algeriensis]MDR7351857.1 osmoprotectant transport system substrate-binding protein [Glycomyces algeriensis]GLI44586.1 glycine/betaine ABC transporter permease [Glycomyces algeriensis]
MNTRTKALGAVALAAVLTATACSSGDPLSSGDSDGDTIVIGSQDYYSSEIIAEIYAQSLEDAGFTVDKQLRIGQREAYLPEIEGGSIDLFPEYTGPLLQYWEPDTEARLSDDVYAALQGATPDGLRVLDQSPATDQDSYTVTRAFADEWSLTTIDDLANVTVPMTMGGNSEGETRPNGPQGLLDTYGVEVGFTPIEDGGGPLTVQALNDGDIQLAIIYTADPSVEANDLVSLQDTKGLFLASHVVPLASDNVNDEAAAVINAVSAAMTPEDLLALNSRSVNEELPAETIAKDWLAETDLG